MTRFRDWPTIRITGVVGDPPEQYEVTYNITGLWETPNGEKAERTLHIVEINLSLGYPRRAPQCKMLTPIFHPNFDEVSICIGDFWAASEGLDDLVVRIGRMISYQEYNIKSPLNGFAEKWAAQNPHRLPVDSTELAPPSAHIETNDVEKIVVTIDGLAGSSAAESETASSQPASETAASSSTVGLPRLDFGTIAIALCAARTTLGRASDNYIQLSDRSVSSHHAELIQSVAGFVLHDLDSTNGCKVNGQRTSEALLKSGDTICFGDIESRLCMD